MKLAVSNIGWAPGRSADVLPALPHHGIEGLVIAPTMIWPDAPLVDARQAKAFRGQVADHGLVIAAMQSLVYGRKDVALSGDGADRNRLAEHLSRQADLAGLLGAASLIFGSPGLRRDVDYEQAVAVFGKAAQAAANNNTKLCIEPLAGYGNEFITTTSEGVRLVERVRNEGHGGGFGLHLDAAALSGAERHHTSPAESAVLGLEGAMRTAGLVSFDASAPDLAPLASDASVPHDLYGAVLRHTGFDGFVSLEMREPKADNPLAVLFDQVDYMRDRYGTA